MHQYAIAGHAVSVRDGDFEVVDGLWAGSRIDCDHRWRAVEGSQTFAGLEFVGSDELLFIFAPEGMVGGGADGGFQAFDVQVDDLGRVVHELAGDDAVTGAGTRRNRWAGFDCEYLGVAVDAAFGDGDVRCSADGYFSCIDPRQRSQQCDVGVGTVGLGSAEFDLPPGFRIDVGSQGKVFFAGRVAGFDPGADVDVADRFRSERGRCGCLLDGFRVCRFRAEDADRGSNQSTQ